MNSQLLSQVRLQLEQDLKQISMEESDMLYISKKSLVIIRDYCRKLSTLIAQCEFKTKEDEIYFFKELKCFYYSQLYYYQDIKVIHAGMPNGSQESKHEFLKSFLHKLNEHFFLNRFIYTYYRTRETENDHQYFALIRRHDSKLDDNGISMFCEDDYSCTHDYLYARAISNDRLEKYLHSELIKLNGQDNANGNSVSSIKRKRLVWTESKAALVELLYALHESKCINDGNIDIRELTKVVEFIFQDLELGDYYRTYIDLKNRTHRTKFIDTLKINLLHRLDNDDEKDISSHINPKK